MSSVNAFFEETVVVFFRHKSQIIRELYIESSNKTLKATAFEHIQYFCVQFNLQIVVSGHVGCCDANSSKA